MSRAIEWAKRVRAANDSVDVARQEQPEPFALFVSASTKYWFSVDEDGTPRLTTPEARNGYTPEATDLLKLADWIRATFGEGPSA